MRACKFLCAVTGLVSSVRALPAISRAPSTINQAAGQGSTIPNVHPSAFQRFPVPNTDTVLYIYQYRPVEQTSLLTVLGNLQLDLNSRYKHNESVASGRYAFQTVTPNERIGDFLVRTYDEQTLKYGTVNETVVGLKKFMVERRLFSNAIFRVETLGQHRAYGVLSIRDGPVNAEVKYVSKLYDDMETSMGLTSSLSGNSPLMLGGANSLELRCTWGDDLAENAIKDVLEDARTKVRVMTLKEGLDGQLPGAAGEWSTEGSLEAKFSIAGKSPAHLTWGNMKDAIDAFSDLTANLFPGFKGMTGKAATCEVRQGTTDVIGSLSIQKG
ncbi:MAG: hypothetical protein Q9169_007850 [Polycauliona sp. 2 TL-2023]